MSYYANEEDDIYQPSSPGRKSRKSKSRHRSKSRHHDEEEAYRENNAVGNYSYADEEDRRRSHRLKGTEVARGEFLSLGRKKASSKKKSQKKTRQERVYDDLYGETNYQEVDDGIVGCADDLCVNKADYVDEDDDLSANKKSSPNTGVQNKVDEEEEVYIVHQRYGYFSIFFGVVQIAVLAVMMWQCGIAPMNINPMFGPFPDALSEWGGKNSILIVEDGEWWRLMTPILLHAGVIHLFCNVAVQLELGVFFEREWGSMTWLIIYLTSALGSSVLSVITMPDAVSVGSSGAVMGLFGGKMAEVIIRCCERSETAQEKVAHQVRREQCLGVGCSVIVVLAFSFMPYVDWAAHLGGLLAGMFVGFVTFSIHMESYCLRLLWFLVGAALTLGFIVPCLDLMYSGDVPMNEELRDVCGYYTQNFDDYECNCMREEYLANLNNFNFMNDDNGAAGDDDARRFLL